MTCDIIIPIFNQVKFTSECVESIIKNTKIFYRIIIIDDNSNDPAMADFLDSIAGPNIKIIRNPDNLGWVRSVNRGLGESSAQYVCIMNNDTIVTGGWLSQMIAVAEKQKDIGLVNPVWEKPGRTTISGYAKRLKEKFDRQYIETDWVRGFCFLVKRGVLDKIKGLDEDYGPGYYDDCDFSVRAIKAGFRCVRAKAAYVYHHRNITHRNAFKQKYLDDLLRRNRKIFYRRWGRPLRIVFVFSQPIKDKEKIQDLLFKLARGQHHLYIWAKDKEMPKVSHTNTKLVSLGALFFRPLIFLSVLNNITRNISKRYDIILTSDILLYNLFSKFGLTKRMKAVLVDFNSSSMAVTIGSHINNLTK